MQSPLIINIEEETIQNINYRQVIFTGNFQLVLMSLMPGDDIPFETHSDLDQFVRVESGKGIVQLEEYNPSINSYDLNEYLLEDGVSVVVPAGTRHFFKNIDAIEPLKLYTIYSSPEHSPNKIDYDQPINHNNN